MDEQQAVRILKKRRSGGVGHIDPTSAEGGDKAQSFEDLHLDKRPSPETWIEMDEFSQEVWRALQQLPAD